MITESRLREIYSDDMVDDFVLWMRGQHHVSVGVYLEQQVQDYLSGNYNNDHRARQGWYRLKG
jgi:hypothetical protein